MILNGLSEEQKLAVTQDGHVLLTSCPGSGKTRVIIHKLAFELSKLDKQSKKKIVALTFTNRAAEEIFRRLNSMGINCDRIWSGTLHAFCLEWILKPYSCYLPELKNGFSIADDSYCEQIVSGLKEVYKLKAIEPVNFRFQRDGRFKDTDVTKMKLLKDYHAILKNQKLIDFELLLYYSFKLLQTYPQIAKNLSHLIKLICVDEYQDTQDLLYAIICTIINAGEGKTSLFLVGDVDQAIYASLGGIAKSFKDIQVEINGALLKPLTLTGNYRSCQRIIDFYSQFQTQPIKIVALGGNKDFQGVVSFNETIDVKDIVPEIARLIQKSLDDGISEDEICVLVPQWWLITKVSKKLRTLLPHVNFDASGLAPMSRNRENIWYKLSRLLLTEPNPKIYSARYRWAREIIDNFYNLTNSDFRNGYNSERMLLRLLNSIKSTESEGINYLKDCFDQFLNIVGIELNRHPQLQEYWDSYFQVINERLTDPEFQIPSDIESFKSFYKEMTGVVINTCVGVKGEEFETVIAYGLLNGYIPHWNEIFSGNSVEASKKLLYVICSRAKSNLHLISEQGRNTKKGTALEITPELKAVNFNYDTV